MMQNQARPATSSVPQTPPTTPPAGGGEDVGVEKVGVHARVSAFSAPTTPCCHCTPCQNVTQPPGNPCFSPTMAPMLLLPEPLLLALGVEAGGEVAGEGLGESGVGAAVP